MEERLWYWTALWSQFPFAGVAMAALQREAAPYGRHWHGEGRSLNPRLAWILMEIPALVFFPYVFFKGDHANRLVPILMLLFFEAHYLNRAIIYPLKIRSGKNMPLHMIALSCIFNFHNAYIQARWVSHFGSYDGGWIWSKKFVLGSIMFVVGMVINIWADSVLISLRVRSGNQRRYDMPEGMLYNLVTCPNYFGEMLEWLGWAIMTWSVAGLAFFFLSVANLGPRAMSHHRWYQMKFLNYPRHRKAVIPFLL